MYINSVASRKWMKSVIHSFLPHKKNVLISLIRNQKNDNFSYCLTAKMNQFFFCCLVLFCFDMMTNHIEKIYISQKISQPTPFSPFLPFSSPFSSIFFQHRILVISFYPGLNIFKIQNKTSRNKKIP